MEEIRHKGRIVSIDRYVTQVEIVRSSACSSCRANKLCAVSDVQKKIVPVPTDAFAMRSVGDEVDLCMKSTMGAKAVWISYVIPLIVLVLAVLVFSACSLSELAVGLGAIASVALYYLVMLCFRDKLKDEFKFYIK